MHQAGSDIEQEESTRCVFFALYFPTAVLTFFMFLIARNKKGISIPLPFPSSIIQIEFRKNHEYAVEFKFDRPS